MKEKKSIAEQVAELTEEQKNTILKVDKYGTIIMLALMIPGLLLLLLGLVTMITDAAMFTLTAYKGMVVLGSLMTALCVGAIVFIKVKFPFYNDRKAAYIRKSRKQK